MGADARPLVFVQNVRQNFVVACGDPADSSDGVGPVQASTTSAEPEPNDEAQGSEVGESSSEDDSTDTEPGNAESDTSRPMLGEVLETVPYDFTPFLNLPLALAPHEPVLFAFGEPGHVSFFSDTVAVSGWNLGSWNTLAEATTSTVFNGRREPS